jgi:hypothetical protein
MSFLGLETSRACSVAIDFGKLFSSSFDFLSFHTARVIFGSRAIRLRGLLYPRGTDIVGLIAQVRKMPTSDIPLRERQGGDVGVTWRLKAACENSRRAALLCLYAIFS